MRDVPEWIMVGKVRRAHGSDGELQVEPLTDFDERFKPGEELFLERPGGAGPERIIVNASRPAGKGLFVRFEGVDGREQARELTGSALLIPFSRLSGAEPGSYYAHELEGCRVYQGGEPIGSVTALRESVANPYLEVNPEGPGNAILVPFVREVITVIDIEAGRIELSEGFLR